MANTYTHIVLKKWLLATCLATFLYIAQAFGQAPIITYPASQTYTVGTAISPLTPTNSGGAVPATVYGQVNTFAGNGTYGSTNATGTAASFGDPFAVAKDASGNVYVADQSDNLIRKISPAGVVTTLAGSGAAGSTNGTGIVASFNEPLGITADASGNVYVADYGNNLIRKITPAGVVTTLAGSIFGGSNNGTGIAASFYEPVGVATDASGNVYVADFGNRLIRKISPAGVVTTLAGSGAYGSTNGTGTSASFGDPSGVATDASGNIFVSDFDGNLIRKISPAGVVTTLAGSGFNGTTNGIGTAASFNYPRGLATDASGNVYVADNGNYLIRKISPSGVVTTLAGSGFNGSTNGTGTAASFSGTFGITADASGNVYVADRDNYLIRKITLTGYTVSPALPTGLSFDATTGVISGTPTVSSATTTYTVTAYNTSGSSATTVNLTVNQSSDATLSALTISSGTLSPAFASGTTSYIATVANSVSSITLTPTVNQTNATVTVNGTAVAGGNASGSISLNVGSNTITTTVIAQDGVTTKSYTLTVNRALAAPNISYLSNQTYTAGTAISPLALTNSGGAIPATVYGQVTTFAGSGATGFTNGTGTAANFTFPGGVATDASGNVYVADQSNNLIRKISPAGVVTTLAGSGASGSTNGTGAGASFYNQPTSPWMPQAMFMWLIIVTSSSAKSALLV